MCLLTIFNFFSFFLPRYFFLIQQETKKEKILRENFPSSTTLNFLRFEMMNTRLGDENRCLGAISKEDFRIFLHLPPTHQTSLFFCCSKFPSRSSQGKKMFRIVNIIKPRAARLGS